MKNIGYCIKTENDNYYYYSAYMNETILINNFLFLIIQEFLKSKIGFNQIKVLNKISKTKKIKPKEFKYYFDKFLFLNKLGYFKKVDIAKHISGRHNNNEIKRSLANTEMLTFEVTENCNLTCNYCGYGKLYNNNENREKGNLNEKTAYLMIDYIFGLWNSKSNMDLNCKKYIAFYGGEPLLNIDLIKKVLSYIENNYNLKFSLTPMMTTNGILVNKYMDFLVKNNFQLTISLDGDKNNNGHRLYHNGKSSFEKVFSNIILLKNKYPSYFKNNVKFNSVLHNKNSVSDIYNFFYSNFETQAGISEIAAYNLNIENQSLFWETYKNSYQSFNEAVKCIPQHASDLMFFLQNPSNLVLKDFCTYFSNIYYKNYSDLFKKKRKIVYKPTGTCMPFEKKIFVAANGDIYPCEKIPFVHPLGNISNNKVNIDFKIIAKKLNGYFEKIIKQCHNCSLYRGCQECLFNLDDFKCHRVANINSVKNFFSSCITNIENNPENFIKIIGPTNYE